MSRLPSLPIASSKIKISIWLSIKFRFVTVKAQPKEKRPKNHLD